MQIQVNTDHNVDGREELVRWVDAELTGALSRFGDRLTRIEVHLGDESAGRATGNDKRCLLEARPTGRPPVVVTHHAATVDSAVNGAIDKLARLLTSTFERADEKKGGDSVRGEETR